jgi:hypothetical protein
MSTFVVSNRNIVIPSPDGRRRVRLPRGFMGAVPDWAAETAYFKALAADGKLVVSVPRSDKELEKEQKAAGRARKKAEEAARTAARGEPPAEDGPAEE